MAVAFGSSSYAEAENSSGSLTISKPGSLSEGDLMVAMLGALNTQNSWSLSGWTQLTAQSDPDFLGSNDGAHTTLAKIADSSDVAASDFTFSCSGADEAMGGIIRVTSSEDGFDISNLIVTDSDFDTDGDPFTGSGGVTPAGPNCFLIFALFQEEDNSASSYAITNDNPTWTEDRDRTGGGGGGAWTQQITQSVAYATRPEDTATGDYTATISQATFGALIAINEKQDVTVNVGTLTAASSLQSTTQSGDANVSVNTLSAQSSLNQTTVTAEADDPWTEVTKDTGENWTHKSK